MAVNSRSGAFSRMGSSAMMDSVFVAPQRTTSFSFFGADTDESSLHPTALRTNAPASTADKIAVMIFFISFPSVFDLYQISPAFSSAICQRSPAQLFCAPS